MTYRTSVQRTGRLQFLFLSASVALLIGPPQCLYAGATVFNVKDYGATGKKTDDATAAIQKAIDACAAAGGGTVYLPPGDYTSAMLHLRSRLRFEIEAGATLFVSQDPKVWDRPGMKALFFGKDIENVSLVGRGTVDGQAQFEWKAGELETVGDHNQRMLALGPLPKRPFSKGFPNPPVTPFLVWIGGSKDIEIRGLKFINASVWTFDLFDCERIVLDGLYVRTSLKAGAYCDGIDLDSCRDASISNCTIETGDDCIALSSGSGSEAKPCENITVTNCRLASSSAGVKFSEYNRAGIRRVVVSNTVFSDVNRGIAIFNAAGGDVSDVVFSNLTINCRRKEWYWAGDGQPFHFVIFPANYLGQPSTDGKPLPVSTIRNVVVHNVIARGMGSSELYGLPESRLEGLTFDNVRLFVSADPKAPFDKAEHAMQVRWAKNLKVKDMEVVWEKPALDAWKSALALENVDGAVIDAFDGRAAWPERELPTLLLNNVANATIRNSRALDGTKVFLKVVGQGSRNILLQGNDLRRATTPYQLDGGAAEGIVEAYHNVP